MTDDDIEIVRNIARHRFLRSTHVAELVGRSIDRTNDRLCHLFHAGYIDRPRAQLDRVPTTGSGAIVYALADRGAKLLRNHGASDLPLIDWGRRNREAGRPFIEHQLEIADFEVSAQISADRSGYHYAGTHDIAARILSAAATAPGVNPLAFRVMVSHRGVRHEIGLVPDIAFELRKGSPRNFLVEIDRGTMPITRADFSQTSIERKLRSYLSANASRLIERRFGWKSFRVLIATSDEHRVRSMIECLRSIQPPGAAGSALFLFATHAELRASDPLTVPWHGIDGRAHSLLP